MERALLLSGAVIWLILAAVVPSKAGSQAWCKYTVLDVLGQIDSNDMLHKVVVEGRVKEEAEAALHIIDRKTHELKIHIGTITDIDRSGFGVFDEETGEDYICIPDGWSKH